MTTELLGVRPAGRRALAFRVVGCVGAVLLAGCVTSTPLPLDARASTVEPMTGLPDLPRAPVAVFVTIPTVELPLVDPAVAPAGFVAAPVVPIVVAPISVVPAPIAAIPVVPGSVGLVADVATPQVLAPTQVPVPVPVLVTPVLVTAVSAVRISPGQPDDVAEVIYSDPVSVGNTVGLNTERLLSIKLAGGDVEWSLSDLSDRILPMMRIRGNAYPSRVAATDGARYQLVFRNRSTKTFEIVTTIDGRDSISGKPGSLNQRGYVLMPLATLVIRGSGSPQDALTPFRFAALPTRLAGQLPTGDAQNFGVLGTALFSVALPAPAPFPGDVSRAEVRVVPVFPYPVAN